jgi:hypothetical protein
MTGHTSLGGGAFICLVLLASSAACLRKEHKIEFLKVSGVGLCGSFFSLMDEILHELKYAFNRREENTALAWSLMRGVFDRYSILLESFATSYIHHQNDQTVAETELLRQSRQFSQRQIISIALLFLNAQYEFISEVISSQLIEETIFLFRCLDAETIKYGASEGTVASPHLTYPLFL